MLDAGDELGSAAGFVEADVRDELPGLRLRWLRLEAPWADPREVRARLRSLSDRFHGAAVVAMRARPVHHAYRAFFRQTGLDPDLQRTPAEEAAMQRLLHGELRAPDALQGALLLALVETGVPVWALAGARVDAAGLGIRQTHEGETLGDADRGPPLHGGRLVVADAHGIHALLFGELAPGHRVLRGGEPVVLFAVGVEGVSEAHLEEALWLAVDALTDS